MSSLYEDVATILGYGREIQEDFFYGYCKTSSGIGYLDDVLDDNIRRGDDSYIPTTFEDKLMLMCKGIGFTLVEDYGGNNEKYGISFFKVYRFVRGDEIIYVKFDGINRSHYGTKFGIFYRVNPVEKNEILYI